MVELYPEIIHKCDKLTFLLGHSRGVVSAISAQCRCIDVVDIVETFHTTWKESYVCMESNHLVRFSSRWNMLCTQIGMLATTGHIH